MKALPPLTPLPALPADQLGAAGAQVVQSLPQVAASRPRSHTVVTFLDPRRTLTMLEPLRQTGFVTTVTLILSMLIALLSALVVQEAQGQPAVESDDSHEIASHEIAARHAAPPSSRWPNFGALMNRRPVTPHPAVARIVVPEGPVTAYGTGTLVDVRDGFGLVVTNWHVVRDATGVVEVVFPSGFRSQARALKVDSDWDLAALVIWQPPIEPVTLADQAPRVGEPLSIHGYGQGHYRIARGRCTQYYAPRVDFPQEMVELDVEARQGDSGGPIFNSRGQLAGVLFGAGQGTTIGSLGGRVESFLATLAPDIGAPSGAHLVASAERPQIPSGRGGGSDVRRPCDPSTGKCEPAAAPQPAIASAWPSSPWSADRQNREPSVSSPWPQAGATAAAPTATPEVAPALASRSDLVERAKSVLAIVGLLAVCIQIVRVVT